MFKVLIGSQFDFVGSTCSCMVIDEKVTKFILNINLSLSFSRLETLDNPELEDKSN